MVLIALLALAVVCVVIGVITSSSVWLIISLVASVLAAAVLLRSYLQLRQRRSAAAGSGTAAGDASSGDASSGVKGASDAEQKGEDGKDNHLTTQNDQPGAAAGASETATAGSGPDASAGSTTVAAATGAADDEVLVVDGSPDYHVAGCALTASDETVPIPLSQALEDGFSPCATCAPPREFAADAVGAPVSPVHEPAPVVTGDGHRGVGRRRQAGIPCRALQHHLRRRPDRGAARPGVEDGFTECSVCTPTAAWGPATAEPSTDTAAVDDGAVAASASPVLTRPRLPRARGCRTHRARPGLGRRRLPGVPPAGLRRADRPVRRGGAPRSGGRGRLPALRRLQSRRRHPRRTARVVAHRDRCRPDRRAGQRRPRRGRGVGDRRPTGVPLDRLPRAHRRLAGDPARPGGRGRLHAVHGL